MNKTRLRLPTVTFPLLCCVLLLLAGCPKPETDSDARSVARPLEGLKLRLTVVDDPALATAIERVQGEWNSQTGAELQVDRATETDLANANTMPSDALVCPSHLLGTLAERKLLVPVPPPILRDPEWGGIFELLRLREAAWGKQILAVPFGSPVLTCYYRADLLEKLGRRPPKTWAEYQEIAKLLSRNSPLSTNLRSMPGEGHNKNSPLPLGEGQGVRAAWAGTIEPLAPGWAGLVLLARAASSAKHRDNYSTLFNIETMEPLVAGPPFVQALEELVATAKFGPAKPFDYDPAKARAAFWRGECGMALAWPTAAERRDEKKELSGQKELVASATSETTNKATKSNSSTFRVGFVELPGSPRVFNLASGAWDTRSEDDDRRVPLLAIAGRLGVVRATSANIPAAFQLLLWLSDSQMSPQVSAASPATTLFRQSNVQMPGQWVEKSIPALAAAQYGDVTQAAFCHEQWLGALRLPGRAEYLAALDEAVAVAVRSEKSALDSLLQADKKWRDITARLGLDVQRAAYRRSVGLE